MTIQTNGNGKHDVTNGAPAQRPELDGGLVVDGGERPAPLPLRSSAESIRIIKRALSLLQTSEHETDRTFAGRAFDALYDLEARRGRSAAAYEPLVEYELAKYGLCAAGYNGVVTKHIARLMADAGIGANGGAT